jgi:hypothetical protein
MTTVKVIVAVAIVAAVLSTAFAVSGQSFVGLLAIAQDSELKKILLGAILQDMAYMIPAEMF